jgi:hypothetical protein
MGRVRIRRIRRRREQEEALLQAIRMGQIMK